ncbi:hypothetical protein ROBYS_41010 [Roseobacter sp. OBYS 0001]|uniref:Sulfatase-modifying factor enzyme-like domain-containing protein n=2 Tax=Roseobacteraceae TaxID=2854170 RepID=F7ZM64_ROSLO|nr:hypothetical protein DUF323 [Roseobacter litoralis Och 149]GIT89085.1 hypothetical protein ROBYS_41010 [Roseobacter sp. OBYS 0001]
MEVERRVGIGMRARKTSMSIALLVSWTVAKVTFATELILMERGTFQMGSDRQYREELPVAEVAVDPFMIGRIEVTSPVQSFR